MDDAKGMVTSRFRVKPGETLTLPDFALDR
jgi:hypothetical protein